MKNNPYITSFSSPIYDNLNNHGDFSLFKWLGISPPVGNVLRLGYTTCLSGARLAWTLFQKGGFFNQKIGKPTYILVEITVSGRKLSRFKIL